MNTAKHVAPILSLGTRIKYGPGAAWTIGMVGLTGGERYYWLHRGNEVAMVPAFILETKAQQ